MLKYPDNASLLVTHFQIKSNELQEPAKGRNHVIPGSVKVLSLCLPLYSLYIRDKIKKCGNRVFNVPHG